MRPLMLSASYKCASATLACKPSIVAMHGSEWEIMMWVASLRLTAHNYAPVMNFITKFVWLNVAWTRHVTLRNKFRFLFVCINELRKILCLTIKLYRYPLVVAIIARFLLLYLFRQKLYFSLWWTEAWSHTSRELSFFVCYLLLQRCM